MHALAALHLYTMKNPFNQTSTTIVARETTFQRLLSEFLAIELALALIIFVVIHAVHQGRRQGLAVWPVVGMLPSLVLELRGDVYEWITGVLAAMGGTFTFRGPCFTNLHCVITSDPRNLEHLLKTKFRSFPKGPYFRSTVGDLLGDGIFNADDEPWRCQRKTASLEFHSAGFRALTAASLVELVHSRLLPVLSAASEAGTYLDLQDVLLRLTFDNVCLISFGTDPGCLRPGLPAIAFAKAFEDATEATIIRFITPTAVWKALKFFDVGSERTLRKSLKQVDEFAYEVIRSRKKQLELHSGDRRADLLTVFSRLREENGKPYSDKFLRDICVNFILAGRDTSSVALAWFFWLLERNAGVEDRILEELQRILKERGDAEDGVGGEVVFKPEEVKKMVYLQAALSESLRLYPPVPVDHKEVIEDEVFPDGTTLKKGTKVIYAIFSMGRMERIWGRDCREFKPERWLRDGRFISESAYKFTAFNGGPRLCLGKEFAYYQMKFIAANIIYRYRLNLAEAHPVVPKMSLTMYMKYGLKVRLTRRHGANPVTSS